MIRTILTILGVFLTVMIIGVSVMLNARFGWTLGSGGIDSWVYSLLLGSADGMKAILPVGIALSWAAYQRVRASVCVVLFIVFTAVSFTSSLGLTALVRSELVGTAKAKSVSYSDLRAEIDTKAGRLVQLGANKLPQQITSEIDTLQQNRRWRATKGCISVTRAKSRVFCEKIFKLQGSLAAANEAVLIRQELSFLRKELRKATSATALRSADPQAAILAKISGSAEKHVQVALIVMIAILVELGSGIGLFAVSGSRKPKGLKVVPATQNTPVIAYNSSIERFLANCTSQAPNAKTVSSEAFNAYEAWCADQGIEPLTLTMFGRELVELGVKKTKSGGRVYYNNLSLTTPLKQAS